MTCRKGSSAPSYGERQPGCKLNPDPGYCKTTGKEPRENWRGPQGASLQQGSKDISQRWSPLQPLTLQRMISQRPVGSLESIQVTTMFPFLTPTFPSPEQLSFIFANTTSTTPHPAAPSPFLTVQNHGAISLLPQVSPANLCTPS